MEKGIDISVWQGNISVDDFIKIKDSGINFVILRCGFTGYGSSKTKNIDKYFEQNYENAKKTGLNVGTYYYSCATTIEEGKEEALYVLNLIKNKTFEYPIYYDIEDNHDTTNSNYANENQITIGKEKLTNIIIEFCNIIEENGYYCGIYASTYWFNNYMDMTKLEKFDKWVAQWSNTRPIISHGLWQYSSTGKVDGINGNVDMNYSYYDYPTLMYENSLNGFIKKEEDTNIDVVIPPIVEDEPKNDENVTDDLEIEDNNVILQSIISKIITKITEFIKNIITSILKR